MLQLNKLMIKIQQLYYIYFTHSPAINIVHWWSFIFVAFLLLVPPWVAYFLPISYVWPYFSLIAYFSCIAL